jgi:F0F1-type ATP synthase epsilon subunit
MTKNPKTNEKLKVVARAPFKLYFEGEADVVSALNLVGQFDILPGHADFFSILEPGEIIIENNSSPSNIVAKNGIITVRNDEVLLFVNI